MGLGNNSSLSDELKKIAKEVRENGVGSKTMRELNKQAEEARILAILSFINSI